MCLVGSGIAGDCFVPTVANGWVENTDEGNMVGDMFVGQFRYLLNNYTFLLFFYFRCKQGFLLFGEETVKCRRGGVFSLPAFLSVLVWGILSQPNSTSTGVGA